MVSKGMAVILISSEIDEIIGLCDRAVVLFEGQVVGEIERGDFSEERILAYSHGHGPMTTTSRGESLNA
jgi:ABC-type sugar transport system ATPase subunit